MQHGIPEGRISPSAYTQGCRCDECKAAYSRYMKEWRAAHPESLGGRQLVLVKCSKCSWTGKRDKRAGWPNITATPCPWCGAPVR